MGNILVNISSKDKILAEALGIPEEDIIKMSLYHQRLHLQRYAFNLDENKIKISRDTATKLNDLYNELTITLDYEYGVDLSCDYIIDFLCFVEGEESRPRCW